MRALCKWASMGMAIVLLAYCGSSRRISSTNVAFLYKPEATSFHPAFVLCHTGDSITRLYFRFRTEELLYSRKEDGKTFRSKVKIKYKLLASADMPKVLDSATALICDSDAYGEKKEIIGYLEIHAFRGNKYLLDVEASDEYRGQKAKQLLDVYKTDRMGRQNFLLCRADGQTPLFRNYVKNGEAIYLKYLGLHSEKLYARYYHRDFPLPGPPFSITEPKPFRYAADSLFTLGLNSANGAALQFSSQGFCHFQVDTAGSNRNGITIYFYGAHFPQVRSTKQMIASMRYITTRKEYESITTVENPKKALDRFWLNNGVTEDRSRELIRQYYTRVERANRFFSSYVPGWMTDRGMIYIVFGPPNTIYRSADSESWIYGEENNMMSLNYTFTRAANPFSDNDYQMSRSPIYKNSWYRAVDSWRQGRAFSSN